MSDQPPRAEDRQIVWDAWKHKHETGRIAHSMHEAVALEHFKATVLFALEAIRTSALINGGALVASLSLVGATSDSAPHLIPHLILAVRSFAIGVICAGTAASSAYLAQYAFTRAHAHVVRNWEFPFVTYKPSGRRWERLGAVFQILGMVCVAASYGAVLHGALTIYWAWSGQ